MREPEPSMGTHKGMPLHLSYTTAWRKPADLSIIPVRGLTPGGSVGASLVGARSLSATITTRSADACQTLRDSLPGAASRQRSLPHAPHLHRHR